jgi:hypothetical protein
MRRTSYRFLRIVGCLSLLSLLMSCGQTDRCATTRCGTGQSCDPADGRCKCGHGLSCAPWEACVDGNRCVIDLPSRCKEGTRWSPGTRVFEEVTEAWGLRAINPVGVRLSAADINGDGYADLYVRRAGSGADDFTDGGTRSTWLLLNQRGQRFVDITESSGITATRRGTDPKKGRPIEVVAFADVDNDGTLDVFTGMSNTDAAHPQTESSEILLNDGTGRFRLGPETSPIRREGELVARAGASFTDVDRDGLVDLWLTNSSVPGQYPDQDQLYRGLGQGEFEEVTGLAGLTTLAWNRATVEQLNQGLGHSWAWSALACDLNGDGTPELLASSYGRAPNHLWLGLRDEFGAVQFTNRSVASGYAYDEGLDWTDNESARCYCKLHRTAPDCANVPEPRWIQCESDSDVFRWDHRYDREPWRLGGNSGTTVCADINNDGQMDLLTTEIRHWDVGSSSDASEILYNTGDPQVRFTRPGGARTGLERSHSTIAWDDGDMTAAVFDFDNDGRPDIYIGSSDYPGTRGHLYWQKPDGTFQEVAITDGIDHKSSHGVAIADYDRDGALDVIVGHSRVRCSASADHCYPEGNVRMFRNLLAAQSNWLELSFEGGPGVNRCAIGARVTVTAGGITQTQEVGGGHGHYGIQHDLTLHFGLGAACEAEVTVRWPDADLTTETFRLVSGYRYRIVTRGRPTVVE